MILLMAVIAAFLWALARGGSFHNLVRVPLRWGGLALLAVAMQAYFVYFPLPRAGGLNVELLSFLISYALLFAVVWANRRLPGVKLMGLGLALNFAVMLANGGFMPITPEALQSVGRAHKAYSLEPGARIRHSKDIVLPREATRLWPLSDVFVLPPPFPIPSVFSPGDLCLAIGAFIFVQEAMRGGSAYDEPL